MKFDGDSWASAAADLLKNSFSKPEHSFTLKAKSSGAKAKAVTTLGKGVQQKVKFEYSVNNIKIKKLEFGTKEQSVAVGAEFSEKLHGVEGLTVSTEFTHKGNTNVGTKKAPEMGQSRSFTAEINFSGVKDLGITATTDMLKLAKGDVSGEAALDYKLGDATLGCNVEYGAKGLKGQFATQYNGGDWNAVLKSNCADGKFANVVGYKHSLGFVANVNKDTQIFGSVGQGKEGQEIAVGGVQAIDSSASLAWKADMKNVTLKYKQKLSSSLELGACTSLPYATSVTGVNFDLTYSP